jgi:hypothetical protein
MKMQAMLFAGMAAVAHGFLSGPYLIEGKTWGICGNNFQCYDRDITKPGWHIQCGTSNNPCSLAKIHAAKGVVCKLPRSCIGTVIEDVGYLKCETSGACDELIFSDKFTGCCEGFCPEHLKGCPPPSPCSLSVHGDDVYKCSNQDGCVKNSKANRQTWDRVASAHPSAVPAGEEFTTSDAEWTVSGGSGDASVKLTADNGSFSFPCDCTCNA